ncbi:MAG: hypothetical protein OEW02_05605, partial [Myxococcales bacterium]|nr:hypothetical protein [Myxococcales bacterium]
MIRIRRLIWLLPPLGIALLAAPALGQLRCENVPQWSREYLRYHVVQKSVTPEIEARTIDTYVLRLDPSRSMLLESEAEAARASLAGIFERMQESDCGQLLGLQEAMLQHY